MTDTLNRARQLDEMVRDFCAVGPRPKSEVRKRIVEFVCAKTAKLRQELAKKNAELGNAKIAIGKLLIDIAELREELENERNLRISASAGWVKTEECYKDRIIRAERELAKLREEKAERGYEGVGGEPESQLASTQQRSNVQSVPSTGFACDCPEGQCEGHAQQVGSPSPERSQPTKTCLCEPSDGLYPGGVESDCPVHGEYEPEGDYVGIGRNGPTPVNPQVAERTQPEQEVQHAGIHTGQNSVVTGGSPSGNETVERTEQAQAEAAYTISAFDYHPIGSRDWCLFWKGWQARAALQPQWVEVVRELVPQTFGEAIKLYPWLKCEPHEWDNRTTIENGHYLRQALLAALPQQENQ